MKLVLVATLMIQFQIQSGFGNEFGEAKVPKQIREATFCVVYELRDPDESDLRLAGDIFDDSDSFGPDERIQGQAAWQMGPSVLTRTLDVAALLRRTVRQKNLLPGQIKKLNRALFKPSVGYPRMSCYAPHHVFVYYNVSGSPVGCAEVCFSCNIMKISLDPHSSKNDENGDPIHIPHLDVPEGFIEIAEVCSEAGLQLGKYKSLESFKLIKANQLKKASESR